MVVVQQAGQIGPLPPSQNFHGRAGQSCYGHGARVSRSTATGWTRASTHLPRLKGGEYYECWYLKSASDPGSEPITAGSFISGHDGSGTFPMTSAANPRAYKVMEIAIQHPGGPATPGDVILRGFAHPL